MTTITNELDTLHMDIMRTKTQVDEVTKTCTELWCTPPQEFFDKDQVRALTTSIREGMSEVRSIIAKLTTKHAMATALRRAAPADKQGPTMRLVKDMNLGMTIAKDWMARIQKAHLQLLNEMVANSLGITVEELERSDVDHVVDGVS